MLRDGRNKRFSAEGLAAFSAAGTWHARQRRPDEPEHWQEYEGHYKERQRHQPHDIMYGLERLQSIYILLLSHVTAAFAVVWQTHTRTHTPFAWYLWYKGYDSLYTFALVRTYQWGTADCGSLQGYRAVKPDPIVGTRRRSWSSLALGKSVVIDRGESLPSSPYPQWSLAACIGGGFRSEETSVRCDEFNPIGSTPTFAQNLRILPRRIYQFGYFFF